MMSRGDLVIAVLVTVLLATASDTAHADRLGGAYRGPKAESVKPKTDEEATPEPEKQDEPASSPDSGVTAEDKDSHGNGSEPVTSEKGTGEEKKKAGGAYRGPAGDAPPPDSREPQGESPSGGGESAGGPSTGGSQTSGGSTSGTTPSAGAASGGASGGAPGGGSGKVGKKGTTHADRAFQRVLWYFEQNREALLFDVTARARKAVPAPPGSAIGELALRPADTRTRTALTTEDRNTIFRVLESHAAIDASSVTRDAAVIALGKLGTEQAVDALLDRLLLEKDVEVRQDILLALGLTRSKRALPALETALSQPNSASFALMALGLTEPGGDSAPIVLDHLNALRKAKDFANRTDEAASAIVALGALGHHAAVPTLASIVKDKDADTVLRVHATHAIGNVGGDKAQSTLLGLLEKGSADVRQAAALSLGAFPTNTVAKKLAGKDGLGRPDALHSGFAAISLARILKTLPESDWKPYVRALADVALKPQKDPVKSQYANLALAILDRVDSATAEFYGDNYDARRLDDDSKTALTLAAGLGNVRAHGDEFAEMSASAGRTPSVRSYAALALAMVSDGDSEKTAAHLRKVYKGTRDADVRRGAVFGLAIVGDRNSVPFLTGVLRNQADDGYVHGAAATALGGIRDSGSLGSVLQLMKSGDPRTRAFTIAALGCMVDKDDTPAMTRLFRHTNFRHQFPTLRVVMEHL